MFEVSASVLSHCIPLDFYIFDTIIFHHDANFLALWIQIHNLTKLDPKIMQLSVLT